MVDIANFRTKTLISVKDTADRLTAGERDDLIEEAVRQYSRDKPRVVTAVLTGDGSAQNFAVPTGWTFRFSTVVTLEHPVDNVPRDLVDLQDNIEVVERADGVESLDLLQITLPSAETARIQFKAQHVLTSTPNSSTIPDNDFDAVCNLASAHIASALAAFYAETRDDTLDADIVNHENKAVLFGEIARSSLAKYKNHIEEGDVATGAQSFHDLDIRDSRGQDLMFHRKIHR